jgi:hypothetical protein
MTEMTLYQERDIRRKFRISMSNALASRNKLLFKLHAMVRCMCRVARRKSTALCHEGRGNNTLGAMCDDLKEFLQEQKYKIHILYHEIRKQSK